MRNPSANTVCITPSARPGTIIETWLGLFSSAQRSVVVTTAFASASGAEVSAGGGCFELTLNGDLVYSKLKTGKFPDEQSVVDAIAARLKR